MKEQNHISTLLVFLLGMNILSYIFNNPLLSYIGTGIGIAGLVIPAFGELFSRLWTGIGHFLGKINGVILLSIVFFILLTPIAFLQKIFSKEDTLGLKKSSQSNFKSRDKKYQKADLEKMW